ncbi:winged helix-turn-helix transcriptional regulator [Thalassotalea sp. LPB0316]|uniref:ArsR/SmtB family transcription factor n=1 Tax=Thalassotalea sp. LPB0316 TaxID=2769490 RepID=UPI001865E884|nr:metalloregulator ArsR/SmtB family transcription factor [Thalassotalea sp. LPB0316]QOL24954.1 winged helix-turn-helix transcriptional regulator [Thalassotalea sp. LPB0316]
MKFDSTLLVDNAAHVAGILKQMANVNRLMILCAISSEELSVSEINERVNLSQSALSQHLAKLREAKLVSTRRDSQTIYYRLSDPKLIKVMNVLYDNYCQLGQGE